MKKIIFSLVTLIVLGTGTGFCQTRSNSHNGNQPRKELVVKHHKENKHCDCHKCLKSPKKHHSHHGKQMPPKTHHHTPS